jgi:hypothetical protein
MGQTGQNGTGGSGNGPSSNPNITAKNVMMSNSVSQATRPALVEQSANVQALKNNPNASAAAVLNARQAVLANEIATNN